MKRKQYDNVFAKMAEHHNSIVPILRELKLSSVKIRNRRIVTLRDTLEHSEKVLMSVDLLTEYLVSNYFFLDLLTKEEKDTVYSLLKSRVKENVCIASNLVYSLIENKKQEIKEKLK